MTTVQEINDICVVTLPFRTIDKRLVDVFIEPRMGDYFLVNDGGKASNELILRGMRITPTIEKDFSVFAQRFGVAYSDEMFQTGTKLAGIPNAVASVGMCSSLAMTELLEYMPQSDEETIDSQFGIILRKWGRDRAKITERVKIDGDLKQHQFDFLVSPAKGKPITVSILNPTAGALSAAERFGFKVKDIAGTQFAKWRRVAVETKAEIWSPDARRIVEKCVDYVIPISSGEKPRFDQVSEVLDRMVA